jgi:hypothetical protein
LEVNNGVRDRRRQYAFDWNGVRRTSSTWQYSRTQQPQRSDAKGVLGLLFGVSAAAVLAAPVVSWVHDHNDAVDIDVDGNADVKVVEGGYTSSSSVSSTIKLIKVSQIPNKSASPKQLPTTVQHPGNGSSVAHRSTT